MTDMSEFEEDGTVTDEQLKVISGLCKQQWELEHEVEQKEEALKEAKRRLRKVQENDLPDALQAAGVTLFKTDDGLKVELKEDLKAAIPAKNKGAAAKWLIDNGLESLVKENVDIPFDKGETEKLHNFLEMLRENGFTDYSVKPTMHTGQIKSSLKELMEQGKDVPEDLFGIYHFKQAIVTK